MSHFMISMDNFVIPMVIDLGEGKFHQFKDPNKAYQYAMETGEYIQTDTTEEADWLAKNYKTEKFKESYGYSEKRKSGGFIIPDNIYEGTEQLIGSNPETIKYQIHGAVIGPSTENLTVRTTGKSMLDDTVDQKFLKALMTKVVGDRKGDFTLNEGMERVVDLFNFTARTESHYNPVKNLDGSLIFKDTGYSNDDTQKHPALSIYQFKHYPTTKGKYSPLETAIRRVKFNPYWFVELQEHMDPRKLTKTQLDTLLLLDYAAGNSDLTGYIQGKLDPIEFYEKYHHRGEKEEILSDEVKEKTKSNTKENYDAFLEEDAKGHYDEYWKFLDD